MNTLIKRLPQRIYNWKSPGDGIRNGIDYIIVNRSFRNAVQSETKNQETKKKYMERRRNNNMSLRNKEIKMTV